MKKTLLALLIILCLFSALTGCSFNEQAESKQEGPHIHSYGEWETVINPTCIQNGVKGKMCDCGDTVTENMSAKGHVVEEINGEAPTCDKQGLTEGKKCLECGEILLAQEPIPAKGHAYGEFTETKEPTCTENGIKIKVCSCGDEITEEIPTNGHSYFLGTCTVCNDVIDTKIEYFYQLSEDETYYIFKGFETNVYKDRIVVPCEYNGKPVKAIGENAFKGLAQKVAEYISTATSFYTIFLPESIEQIGKNAFEQCGGIKVRLYRVENDSIREITAESSVYDWIAKTTIEEGSNGLIEVVGYLKPAFGWSNYSYAKYYVRLDLDGGVATDSSGIEINELFIKPNSSYYIPIPTKDGYTFDGWYYKDTKIEPEGEKWTLYYIELTAKWSVQ